MYISELLPQLKGGGRKEDNIPIFIKPQSDYDDYIFKSLFSKRLQNYVM